MNYKYAPQKQIFVDGKSVIVPHVRRKNDDNVIVLVLNSTKKHESHKLKNVYEIYVQDDDIVIECVEKVKNGYIPTMYKIQIETYLFLLDRYRRGLPMIDYFKEDDADERLEKIRNRLLNRKLRLP